jgi:hypothetical protein
VRALRAVLLLAVAPLALGLLNVTYQDAAMTHLPGKAATVEMIRAREFPFLNPYASFGQPLAGNPNFGTFWPDTLLFLILPLHVAFGLHFALAFVLGYAGARRWARAEGVSRGAAEVAAVAFVCSGVFVSAWKFYNTGVALAAAPWVLAAGVKLLRRVESARPRARWAAAELALWSALQVLAGEPVVALLVFVVLAARVVAWWLQRGRAQARAALAHLALAAGLAALLAGPQIALTAQIYADSSREERPFPFVTATGTSLHPLRLLEQFVAFPFGRPDLQGDGRFNGHEVHDHHAPYLWTLHLGLAALALLVVFGRLRGPEGLWYALALVAIVLSFGHHLPLAKKLYPLLSVGGRVRFPVKWWYVVALCLVPLVAWAAERWTMGEAAPRHWRLGLAGLAAGLAAVAWWAPVLTPLSLAPLLLACLAMLMAAPLVAPARPRPPAPLGAGLAVVGLAAASPLLLAVLDRPLADPPRLGGGRVYERVRVDTHPQPGAETPPESTTRAVMRRVPIELWAINGALSGNAYAFDRDPDGSYADPDRAVRKPLEELPWAERAALLRRSGVSWVVTDEGLSAPYRPVRVLSAAHGVQLYALDGAQPIVRVTGGTAQFVAVRGRPSRLRATVNTTGGLLVWSRSHFGAWRATVNGVPAAIVRAEGHLVGVPLGAGEHVIEVCWSSWPLIVGAVCAVLGLVALVLLRRS